MGCTQFFNCARLHSITGGKEVLVCNVCNDKSIMMSTLRGVKSTYLQSLRLRCVLFDVSIYRWLHYMFHAFQDLMMIVFEVI